jgi:hypothetical protein
MSAQYDMLRFYVFFVTIVLLVSFVSHVLAILFTRFQKKITVSEKYVKPSYKKTYYHFVDADENNYQLKDSLFLWEFDSGNDYAKLKPGQSYQVHGYWFRFPLFSWYPQIYKLERTS